ncbi:hypothetical protein JCGZ_04951 [Jatropha curcas]|uniref:Aminotransferase-like plant mobile domain-containing protein n=1 Tax=Jatropha curcas TaxID=180498 RepID=A0A067KXX8_JATCU|nr:hypothetical protein JCGZ_04951 [Jatropha curcas]
MRYALMDRWNDCTHTFIFGFREMTLTPADYTAITGLGFDGAVAPLDARYQTAALRAKLVRTLLGVTTRTRCGLTSTGVTLVVREVMFQLMLGGFLSIWRIATIPSPLLLTPWEGDAWEAYPARTVAEAYTRSRFLLQGYWLDWYFLGERIYELQVATAQRRVPDAPPCDMCLLEGMTPEDLLEEYDGSPADIPLSAGDYASYFSTRLQARLQEVREYIQEEASNHRILQGTGGDRGGGECVLVYVPFPPGMEVALDPALGLGLAIIIPADLRQAPPPLQLDPEHATHDLEIGRLRRHQSRQSTTVTRL